RFTDFPDPASAAAPAVSLAAGQVAVDATITVDLVHKAVVVLPLQELTPSTQYELVIATSQSPTSTGLTSLSGAGLLGRRPTDATVVVRFTTGTTHGGGPQPPPAPTPPPDAQP